MTKPDRSGDYITLAGTQYPLRGSKQRNTAALAVRAAGMHAAPICHWDGFDWTDTGMVINAAPAPVGRPARAESAASIRVTIRLTEQESARYEQAAKDAGLSLSDWLRGAAELAHARGSLR